MFDPAPSAVGASAPSAPAQAVVPLARDVRPADYTVIFVTGAERLNAQVVDALLHARAMIADPACWCWGFLQVGAKRCAIGALIDATGFDSQEVFEAAGLALCAAALKLYGVSDPALVNDQRGHAATLSMFDAAIAARA